MYRTKMPLGWVVLIGCVAYGFAVWLGIAWPWVASFKVWFWVIVLYAFVVAAIPVVHVETPRGALNAVLMGLGLIFLFIGVFALGIARPEAATIKMPMWGGFLKIMPGPGPLWPIMPIVATCGAIAGFHALVSSTVTAHQLADETHARQVVWGSMALEYLVAIWGLMAVCTIGMEVYLKTVVKSPLPLYGMGTANLMSAFGMDPRFVATIFMCVLVAFMTTSLDTIARVGRFMLAGLSGFMPSGPRQLFGNFQFSTGVTCAVGALLGATGTFLTLWPMVGIAIQSVAVLTFAIITGYLLVYNRSYTLAVISFIFLGITVAAGGVWLTYFHAKLGGWHWITSTMALVVLICEIAFMVFFVRRWQLYRESNSIEELESKLGLLAKAEG